MILFARKHLLEILLTGLWLSLLFTAGGRLSTALFIVPALVFILLWLLVRRGVPLEAGVVSKLWAGIVIVSAISLVYSIHKEATVITTLWSVTALGIVSIVTSYRRWIDQSGTKLLWSVYSASTLAVLAGYGLYFSVSDVARLRFEGVLFQHNVSAILLILGLACGLALMRISQTKFIRVCVQGAFLLHLIALLLTLSRGALLALFGALAVMLVFRVCEKKIPAIGWKRILSTVGVFLIATLGAYGLFTLRQHIGKVSESSPRDIALYPAETGEVNALTSRLEYMRVALRAIRVYPFTGVGAGAYWDAEREYRDTAFYSTSDPHSLYLRFFAELGIFGGFVFLVLTIGLLIWYAIGAFRKRFLFERRERCAFLLALVFAFHFSIDVHGMFPLSIIAYLVILVELFQVKKTVVVSRVSSRVVLTMYFILLCFGCALMQSYVYSDGAKTAQTLESMYSFSKTATRLFPFNTEALMSLASLGLENSEYAREGYESIESLTSDVRPHHSAALELRARYAQLRGERVQAREYLEKAVRFAPVLGLDFRLILVRDLISGGERDRALTVIREGLAYFPESVFANEWWGDPKKELYRVQVLELRRLEQELERVEKK